MSDAVPKNYVQHSQASNEKRRETMRRRWAEKSPEQRRLHGEQARLCWTDEKRNLHGQKMSEIHHRSDVEEKRKEKFKATLATRTPERWAEIGEKVRKARLHLTIEQKALRKMRVQEAWQSFSPEHKKQFSDRHSVLNIERMKKTGREFGRYGKKCTFHSARLNKDFYCSSVMELLCFQLLEKDLLVLSFSRCSYWVPYFSTQDQKNHRYLPDIEVSFVDGRKVVIEVKPEWWVSHGQNPDKFAAALPFFSIRGIEFQVWTEKKLGVA